MENLQNINENAILKELAKLIINNNNQNGSNLLITQGYKNFIDYSYTRCRIDSIQYYKKIFDKALTWFNQNNILYIEEITRDVMNHLVKDLKEINHFKNNTINKYIEVIKMITKYNYDNELSSQNKISAYKKLPKEVLSVTLSVGKFVKMIESKIYS